MKKVFVTGATGIIGSNICTQLIAKGDKVRTIARSPNSADAKALQKAGVEVLPGDVGELSSVQKAADGMDAVIHSAAMLGRPGATMEEGFPTNVLGTINTLTAAAAVGGIPVVQLITTTFFDMWEKPFTEFSPLDLMCRNTDVYTVTKRLAFVEGLGRVAEGQDIRFMVPGAVYGPSVCVEKAMSANSFNDRMAKSIRGEMGPLLPLPMPFVTAGDCAWVCIAALERGTKGERYLAHGRTEEIDTLANLCNLACRVAGVSNRVTEIPRDQLDSPETIKRFGPTTPGLAKRTYPKPFSDSSFTQKRLGYVPTPHDKGFRETIDWMRTLKVI